jgi:hypothetical protein
MNSPFIMIWEKSVDVPDMSKHKSKGNVGFLQPNTKASSSHSRIDPTVEWLDPRYRLQFNK